MIQRIDCSDVPLIRIEAGNRRTAFVNLRAIATIETVPDVYQPGTYTTVPGSTIIHLVNGRTFELSAEDWAALRSLLGIVESASPT